MTRRIWIRRRIRGLVYLHGGTFTCMHAMYICIDVALIGIIEIPTTFR